MACLQNIIETDFLVTFPVDAEKRRSGNPPQLTFQKISYMFASCDVDG